MAYFKQGVYLIMKEPGQVMADAFRVSYEAFSDYTIETKSFIVYRILWCENNVVDGLVFWVDP